MIVLRQGFPAGGQWVPEVASATAVQQRRTWGAPRAGGTDDTIHKARVVEVTGLYTASTVHVAGVGRVILETVQCQYCPLGRDEGIPGTCLCSIAGIVSGSCPWGS